MSPVPSNVDYHQAPDPIGAASLRTMTETPEAPAQTPVSKGAAGYKVSGGDLNACGGCKHGRFRDAGGFAGEYGACDIVAGPIRAGYVCSYWDAAGPTNDDVAGNDDDA